MTKTRQILRASALALALFTTHAAADESVVASIKPVHSLVAAIMEGVGEPQLLVGGAGSPHTYSMRPSEARMLEDATVVFWVGPELEIFLANPLETLAGDARVVPLSHAPGLVELPFREGGAFDAHDHDDGGHAGHDDDDHHGDEAHAHDDEHAHDDGHAHEEDEHAHGDGDDHAHEHDHAHAHDEQEGDHDEHAHHDHGEIDMHLWLDPENARAMAGRIAETLVEADPENAQAYRDNAAALGVRLDALIAETSETLAPVRHKPYVVFHDAYQYFERRFDIPASGSITVSPESIPGAGRISEIQEKIGELDAACVFSEPQFEPKLVDVVTEGTNAHAGVLDPLGAEIDDGPELYFTLIRNMARSLADCLSADA